MGSKIITTTRTTLAFIIIFNYLPLMMIHCGGNVQDLDDLIRTYAARVITRRHTGSLYQITLPANLSDVKASVVTVRNSMFWRNGANFSGFIIPPLVKTMPFAKRIALVYQISSSSSVYFRLSDNYSFVSPVIGFTVYDATNTNYLRYEKLRLSIDKDNPITINFDSYITHQRRRNDSLIKCVAFEDGSFNFTKMTRNYKCATTNSHGHYALVIINPKSKPKSETKTWKNWWWIFLAAIGILGLVIGGIVVLVKLIRKKRLRKMERESEINEMIDNIWIGRSRMPAAAMVRTQPNLEDEEDLPPSNVPF